MKAAPEGGRWIRGRSLLIIFVLAAGAFGVGYALSALAFTSAAAPADVALVPDVRELPLDQAGRRLAAEDLILAVGDSFPNAEIPAGSVLAQTPLPGNEVALGTEVRVVVSTGRHRSPVPDVSTMTVAMATRALQTAGFEVIIEEAPGEAAPGEVVEVNPPTGTPLEIPDTVVLRIGALPPFVWMPQVIGLSEDSARATLESAGLRVTEVMYDNDPEVEPYQVIAQDPLPGDSVDSGGAVRLRVTMPGVDRPTSRRGDSDEPDGSVLLNGD